SEEMNDADSASSNPTSNPPAIAPGTLPKPPMTIPIQAFTISGNPMWGSARKMGARKNPASPEIALLMAKVVTIIRPTLIPESLAAYLSSAVARSFQPSDVLVNSQYWATRRMIVSAMMARFWVERLIPATVRMGTEKNGSIEIGLGPAMAWIPFCRMIPAPMVVIRTGTIDRSFSDE